MFAKHTKFLIADDFTAMRKMIKNMLREEGFTNIHETDNGQKALECLQQAVETNEPFEVIISDWNMPGLSGIDLLKQCRADTKISHIPFLLVTADADQKNILEAVQAGVSDCMVKPFSTQILKQKLQCVYQKTFKQSA